MDKGKYLDSWKEISAYLGRNIRTCRNWERDLGLPVHRLDGALKAHVFAYTGEIDAWREEKGRLPEEGKTGPGDMESPGRTSAQDPVSSRRPARTWLIIGLVAAPLLTVIATALITRQLRPISKPAVGRFTIKLEPGHWLEGGRNVMELERPSRTAMAISRDGRFVIYSGIEANPGPLAKSRLFLRRMAQTEATTISGTEGGINPFLSPDNRWVGFWADGQLKKVPLEGGVPNTLCELSPWFYGASWGRDDTIVFTDVYDTGLSIISSEGGVPEVLTKPDPKREEYSHRLPSWLPNGKAVLFTIMRHAWDKQPWLALLRMDTRQWRVLLQDAADARYVPTGHLVFLRRGTLMAVRFDLAGMKIIGQPVSLMENVMQAFSDASYYHTGAGQFGVSETGSLVFAAGGILPDNEQLLVWVDHGGVEQPVVDQKFPYSFPRLSPDGQRIAYVTTGREKRIYVYDLGRGTNSQLTTEGIVLFSPIWSPDGKRLLFSWMKSLVTNLFWQPYDGSSAMERLTTSEYFHVAGSWTSDGKMVALVELRPDTKFDIAILDVLSGRVTAFLNSPYNEGYPDFSPDGRWLAYMSDETNRDEVYIRAFPGPGLKHQVSSKGGDQPLWSRDGSQLFYRWEGQVWVVDVRTNRGFTTSKPRLLFDKPGYDFTYPMRDYDLSLDGQRFLMVKLEPRKPEPVSEMILVENWLRELERLVPLGKKSDP
jgi:eukaryotic-like serine/threonine-protein kinase